MDAEQIWQFLEPKITDDLERLRARVLARGQTDERDTRTIFLPLLRCAARMAGGDPRRLVDNRLSDWQPGDVNEDSLRVFISRLVEAATPPTPLIDREAMQRRMAEIERELTA